MSTYVATDGTRIAYRTTGEGPALVLSNGLTTNTAFWKNVLPLWAPGHRLLSWDLPGHGASGPARTAGSATVQAQGRFVIKLMQACGIERAVQIGWSTGCQVVLEVYRQAPERCDALALILGAAGRVLDTTRLPLPGAVLEKLARRAPRRVFGALYRTASRGARAPGAHAVGRMLGLIGRETTREDARGVLQHIPSVDPGTLQALLVSLAAHDATDVLATARVPSLLVAGDRDPFAPSALVGLPLHRASARSELLRLPRGTHTALLDHADEIGRAVLELERRALARGAPPVP